MFMTNFILFLLGAGLSYVEGYTNVGSCGGSNDLTLDGAGCDRHFDDRDDTCTNDVFNLHYDGCQRSCQVPCQEHPLGRDARCDDDDKTTEGCRIRDLIRCSQDCGRNGVYTAVYTACSAGTQEPIYCPDFCCCGPCEGPGNPYNNPICTCNGLSPRPIPPYKSCADRDSPINTAVCNNLCPHVECADGEIIGGDDGCTCVSPPTPTCPDGMLEDARQPGSCFVYELSPVAWDAARANCVNDYGGWMVEITTAGRRDIVTDMIEASPFLDGTAKSAWVGGHQDGNNPEYYWMTHSNPWVLIPGPHITWGGSEPEPGATHDCVLICTNCAFDERLFDYTCSLVLPYMCEYSI